MITSSDRRGEPEQCHAVPADEDGLLAVAAGGEHEVASGTSPAAPAVGVNQEQLLHQIMDVVAEVRDLLVTQRLVRDYYSTEQTAKILSKANWTVREWCRLGRVHAEKRHSGRGRSQEWVISHAELLRIQKEGLLPVAKYRL